jgi:hypothetical protein
MQYKTTESETRLRVYKRMQDTTWPGQVKADRIRPDQTPRQDHIGQIRLDPTRPDQIRPDQIRQSKIR